MRKSICFLLGIICWLHSSAQFSIDSISEHDAAFILNYLTADSLKGRGNYQPALHRAAHFIADRFTEYGLVTYFQFFGHKKITDSKDSGKGHDPANVLLNVIGVLRGKTKPDQAVIFSAHFDHLGVYDGTVFNGANDNASGTTALLLLANYFARLNNNQRTLIFCAFSGEELGMLGSSAFVHKITPDSIVAMINIEMIGIPLIGKNSFFITGSQHSDLQKIMERNLQKKIKIKRDPDYSKALFKRSDNFPFAEKGVPAHTIMCGDDEEMCYHQSCDDFRRIDLANMLAVIRSIPLAMSTIINGEEAPKRINPKTIY